MAEERRRSTRVHCLVPIRFYPEGAGQAIETLTKDLGTGGLCVFSPIALPASCHVTAEAIFGTGQPPVPFCAMAAWSQPTESGNQFCVGLHFDHPNTPLHRQVSEYISKLSYQLSA